MFKTKKEYALFQSEVSKGENLKMISFNYSMKKMVFFRNFQHLEHLKKWSSWKKEHISTRDGQDHAQW